MGARDYLGRPEPLYHGHMAKTLEKATLGGGCFWCLDAYYRRVKGIGSVVSGYSGGHTDDPTMEQVYRGDTGHAEAVQLAYDPKIITYREILEIFYVMHDPTTLNRQGNDVGDEYRSVIFYHDADQKKTAEAVTRDFAAPLWDDPIVTQIVPFKKFWPAEDNQQDFYAKYPQVGYCQVIIEPKIRRLREKFAAKLR